VKKILWMHSWVYSQKLLLCLVYMRCHCHLTHRSAPTESAKGSQLVPRFAVADASRISSVVSPYPGIQLCEIEGGSGLTFRGMAWLHAPNASMQNRAVDHKHSPTCGGVVRPFCHGRARGQRRGLEICCTGIGSPDWCM
jgi:hypothetical protein